MKMLKKFDRFIMDLDTPADYEAAEKQYMAHFKNFKMPEGDR